MGIEDKDGPEMTLFKIGLKELSMIGALVVSIATGNSPEEMMSNFGLFEKGDKEEIENARQLTSAMLARAMSELEKDFVIMEKKENGKKENMA